MNNKFYANNSVQEKIFYQAKKLREILQPICLKEYNNKPQGMCLHFSIILRDYLKNKFISAQIVIMAGSYITQDKELQGHFWVEVDNKFIVDITADQFGDNCVICLEKELAKNYHGDYPDGMSPEITKKILNDFKVNDVQRYLEKYVEETINFTFLP